MNVLASIRTAYKRVSVAVGNSGIYGGSRKGRRS